MAWYGLIMAAAGVLAIAGTLWGADPAGRMPRPELARVLVLGASILIWAGLCLAILGLLAVPAAAAEAVPGAASWPAELASGIGVVVLAVGVVVLAVGVIDRLGLSGPLPFGVALVAVGIVLWIVSAAWASPAAAQGRICAPMAEMQAFLRDRHGEAAIGGGQVGGGYALLVFASADGKSFTLLVVEAGSGKACLLATGADWDPGTLPGKGT